MDGLEASKSPFVHGRKRRINCIAININVFIPWIVFIAVYFISSFKIIYLYPTGAKIAIGVIAFLCIGAGAGLVWSTKDEYTPYWYKFVTFQFVVAITAGYTAGYWNHFWHMMPYYDWQRLKVYPHVDVSKEIGQNLMDAGTIYFSQGTSIDIAQSAHFMTDKVPDVNGEFAVHRYCVAPIIAGGPPGTGTYDFWAIGKDCCSAASTDYRCGDFANGNARSGLRLVFDPDRPYYKLAVKQAEALYGYKANHPLFFEWIQDPLDKIHSFGQAGNDWYMVGVAGFLCYNFIAVALATCKFAFIGRAPQSV